MFTVSALPRRRYQAMVLLIGVAALILWSPGHPRAASATIVISQVYGGGGNTGAPYKNDFVVLFNRSASPVSLTGMSIQYASATGTGNFGSNPITAVTGTLAAGQYYLVQLAGGANGVALPTPDATGTANMSGTGGKVALVNSTSGLACNGGSTPCSAAQLALIVDLVGWDGANFYEGTPAPATTNSTAVVRKGNGCTDTDNNAGDFTALAPAPLTTASPASPCSTLLGTGAATPASAPDGGTTLLTVVVTPGTNPASTGISVAGNLTAIGGAAAQTLYDDGTHGDATPGDLVFSFSATVGTAAAGPKSLPITISDAQGRTGLFSIAFYVEPAFVAVHDIQGPGATSPVVGQPVATIGIVTGIRSTGYFIQVPDEAQASCGVGPDADPLSSEGVFVFTSSAPQAAAAIGNCVKVIGTVQEYIPSADPASPPMTEVGGSPLATVISSGNALPQPVLVTPAFTSPDDGLEQLERFEGMRVRVDTLVVVAPTQGSISEANATAISNGVFYGVLLGVDRPFRELGIQLPDPLPPGAPATIPRFDGNPERLRVDSDGQVGGTLLNVTTGVVVTGLVGPLDYAFRTYTILPDPPPATQPSVTANATAVPVAAAEEDQFTVASINLQRFYDTQNDPDTSDTVLTAAAFEKRLNKVSLLVRDVMRSPDLIGIQEVENLTTLQGVAARINADAVAAGQPDPAYEAYLEEGNDIGGIDVGFLVRASRLTVAEVKQYGKDATYINPNTGLPEILNDRPPLVLKATIADPRGGPAFPVTAVVNHLRSLTGIDEDTGPSPEGPRVRAKREAQAEFLARLIQPMQAIEHVVSVGDYNAYQFNDGYVDVIGAIVGEPAQTGQVTVVSPDLVNPNLTDLTNLAVPAERYSYLLDGNAEELDHVLVSSNMLPRLDWIACARSNADFPETYRSDANRPERVSDHDAVVAAFSFPTADVEIAKSGAPDPVLSGSTVTYTLGVSNTSPDPAMDLAVSDRLPAGMASQAVSVPAGWTCSAPSARDIACAAPQLAAGATAAISITAGVQCDIANHTALANQAHVSSSTFDPVPANNDAAFVSTVSNPPPVIANLEASPAVLWPANHEFVPVYIDYDVSDNCGPPPVCTLSVASNEPVNGRGDGNMSVDWTVVDGHRVQLRAERSGTGRGRIYTISVTCADQIGNASTRATQVMVPKSRK